MRPPGEGFELGVRFPPPEGRLISKRAGVVALFFGRDGRKARTERRGPKGPPPTHVCLVRETRLLPPKAGRLASRSAKPTLDGSSLITITWKRAEMKWKIGGREGSQRDIPP